MTWKWVPALALIALATACSGGGTKGLSVSTRAAGSAAAVAAGGRLVLANGVTIDRIRMVAREVSVEAEDGAGCAVAPGMGDDDGDGMGAAAPAGMAAKDDGDHSPGEGEGDEGCEEELEFGPFYVEIAGADLAGAVSHAFDVAVPPGVYDEIEIKLNTLPAEKAGMDPGLLAMADAHASIAVDGVLDAGTPDEKPFTFVTPMEVTQKREGSFTVDPEAGANVTLDFDPQGWFTGPGGDRLDPTDPTNQGQILANIRASIRLLRDDDANGCDDDHGGDCGP